MAIMIIRALGFLNGFVSIQKTLEIEDNLIEVYSGTNNKDALIALLAVYYPGVKFNPNSIKLEIKRK